MRERRPFYRCTATGGVFYGWPVLGIAMAMGVCTMPGQSVVLGGLFSDPIRRELGLGLSTISGAYSIATIAAGMALPWIGKAADRFGVRATSLVVVIAFCGAILALGRVVDLWTVGGAFFAMRLLGQGALGALAGHAIAMWFERRLGRVHGVLATAFALGSFAVPPIVELAIQQVGWRTTTTLTAAVVASIMIPPIVLALRNRPEDIGQHLDGDAAEHAEHDVAHGGPPPKGDPGFTLGEAVRTRAYWVLLLVLCYAGVVGTAVLFHAKPMLDSVGAPRSLAAIMASTWAIVQLPITLSGGWLADHFEPRRLLPLGPLLLLVGCGVMALGLGVPGLPAGAVMIGAMAILGLGQGVIPAVASPAIGTNPESACPPPSITWSRACRSASSHRSTPSLTRAGRHAPATSKRRYDSNALRRTWAGWRRRVWPSTRSMSLGWRAYWSSATRRSPPSQRTCRVFSPAPSKRVRRGAPAPGGQT